MLELFNHLTNWVNVEPMVGLLMLITAIVLFGSAFRDYKEDNISFWPWLRRFLEICTRALIGAIMFVGLMWAFRIILNDNVASFYSTHGSLSDVSRSSAFTIWGRPHRQVELTVNHSIEVEEQQEQPRENPDDPPVYKTVLVRKDVPQNSIIGFAGDVDMKLSEREKGYALYSGYTLGVKLVYQVVNDSNVLTDADFTFPLSNGQTLFEDFIISMDDVDMSSKLRVANDLVSWRTQMKPGQKSEIIITYSSRGMDYFYYQIPVQREIKDFILTLTVDRLPISLVNYPDGVITPTEIKPTADRRGSILTWKLDRAITVAGMGVSLMPPEQPGAQVLRVLVVSPYALTLLGAMLALTMLIWGTTVRFLDLSLLSAVYSMQFLLMAAISDYFLGFWESLVVGALLTLFLSYLLFRKLPTREMRLSVYGLILFFTTIYPLSGLLTDVSQQNAFHAFVQVGMISYIAGLSLYVMGYKSAEQPGKV
ncbi:MAG: hypothetical protein IPP66_14645 [Anaerolineales bacterium]|nr:hypothetical protein [Anaerolineales bacterium]